MTSLDDQLMAFADRAEAISHQEQVHALRTSAATIREAWSGADAYPTLADALEAVAAAAESAMQVVQGLTVPPMA